MVWRARQGAGGTQLQILRQGHWATTLPGSPRGLASHQAVYPAQPDAAHSMCQCRHLLLTQQRAAVPDTPADGDQAPRLVAPHHPARSHRKPRNTDPGPWPGTLRTGPRGHCSKDGSGTPPWTLRGLDTSSRSATLVTSQPQRSRELFSYCSLSFFICEREIIRVLPHRVVVKGVII